MVIPSRQDNLPNTGVEAHQRTVYLAKAFDEEDFAKGIVWVLAQRATGRLGKQAWERYMFCCSSASMFRLSRQPSA